MIDDRWLADLDERARRMLDAEEVGVSIGPRDGAADAKAASTTRAAFPSMYYAAFVLPRRMRHDFFVVAAFLRDADVLSEAADPIGRASWSRFCRESLAPEPPNDDVLRAFADLRVRHQIPRAWIEAELEGLSNDHLAHDHRTFEDVVGYCFAVLAPVGLLMARILGVRDRRTAMYAARFATAAQLTDLLWDVAEDFAAGHVSLPRDELRAHGIDPDDLGAQTRTVAWRAFMHRMIARNRALYAAAEPGITRLPFGAGLATTVIGALSRARLDDIEAADYDVFAVGSELRLGHFAKALGAGVRFVASRLAPSRGGWRLSRRAGR